MIALQQGEVVDAIPERGEVKGVDVVAVAFVGAVGEQPAFLFFAEAEEDVALRAAIQFRDFGYGTPVLVGRTEKVLEKLEELGVDNVDDYIIENSVTSEHIDEMAAYLYNRLQRRGYTERDVRRMVNQERNVFASLLVALGHGDGMITGLTRTFSQSGREIGRVLDAKPGATPFGIHMVVGKNHTTFLADTTINERPTSEPVSYTHLTLPTNREV